LEFSNRPVFQMYWILRYLYLETHGSTLTMPMSFPLIPLHMTIRQRLIEANISSSAGPSAFAEGKGKGDTKS
jgi:hypothetical protein